MLNLDTNVIVQALAGTLRWDERGVLESEPWSISAIVLWEIDRLYRSGRLRYGLDDSRVVEVLAGTQNA